jgi:hypothetical protein
MSAIYLADVIRCALVSGPSLLRLGHPLRPSGPSLLHLGLPLRVLVGFASA